MSSRSNKNSMTDPMDSLLREVKPGVSIPRDLEARIRSAVAEDRKMGQAPIGRWLAVAAVVVVFVVFNRPGEQPLDPPKLAKAQELPVSEPVSIENPLRHEAMALRRDVDRTGRFLLDALPSLSLVEP